MGKIALCADSDSLAHPELLGLEDVSLDAVSWLACFSCAAELRERLRAGLEADEVWIVSSDDVEAINLLAALRKDNPETTLLLVVQKASGSILSRAQNAGASATLTAKGFAERFALENLRHTRMEVSEHGDRGLYGNGGLPGSDGPLGGYGSRDGGSLLGGTSLDEASLDDGLLDDIPKLRPDTDRGKPARFELQVERGSGQAFVLTVLSGSGGAGKSTVSAISAATAAERGHKTLLIDCDLQFGDIHRLMGVRDPLTLDDILEDPDKLESLGAGDVCGVEAAGKGDSGCGPYLLAAPKRLEQSEVIGQYLPKILDSASSLFDVIVVNTGANWADHHAVLLERSECSLLLVDQRTSSVRACQHALELCSRLGVASGAFAYAVNHCERGALFTSLDVAFVMQGAHVYELKEGGSAVEEMLGAGQLADLMSSKNNLCISVGEMLSEILPEHQSGSKKRKRMKRKKTSDSNADCGSCSDPYAFGTQAGAHDVQGAIGTSSSRRRSSRRRGRSTSKLEGIPVVEEEASSFFSSHKNKEDKVPGLWR